VKSQCVFEPYFHHKSTCLLQPQDMTVLDDLPNEVLTEILSYLHSSEDSLGWQHRSLKRDFWSLSLCSRRLHELVEAPLYSCIDGTCSITAALITRTLLDRPRLALLVREAMFEVSDVEDMSPMNKELLGSFVVDSLHTAVATTGIFDRERAAWVADFKAGRSDARQALMLSMLPNLRTLLLDVYSPFQYINTLAQHVSGLALVSRSTPRSSSEKRQEPTCQRALASLRDVRIEAQMSLGYDETLPIMSLPSLQSLHTQGLSASRYSWEPPPDSSVVRRLGLHRCEMSEDEVFLMLRSCKALRTLEYEWDQSWSEEDIQDDEWDCGVELGPMITKGLASNKSSLEALMINGLSAIRNDVMSFGSLLDFKSLKRIRVPSVIILNRGRDGVKRRLVDVLPTALETLHLINDGLPGERSLITELLELVRSQRCSRVLQQITIEHVGRFTIKFQGTPDVARLEAACANAGIAFTLQLPTCSSG
jgi:F-box-like